MSDDTSDSEVLRYGSFKINESSGCASWNGDASLQFDMKQTNYDFCQFETFWNQAGLTTDFQCDTAMTGFCLWSKYDALLKFKAVEKGNSGAVRSLSNPKDRLDIEKRLRNGHIVENISIAKTPFNQYQSNMLAWQAEVIKRLGIKKVYFSIPIDEYKYELEIILKNLDKSKMDFIFDRLSHHFDMVQERIFSEIQAEVEFVHPMRIKKMTPNESYMWPYMNLKPDLGIEEIEEIKIPYTAMKLGAPVPPIMLGVIGYPVPSYLHHDQQLQYENFFAVESNDFKVKEKSHLLMQSASNKLRPLNTQTVINASIL